MGNSNRSAEMPSTAAAMPYRRRSKKRCQGGNTTSAVFGECAAQRGMMVFSTGAYYPETWYRKYHPFLWGGVMECERVSYQVAEYIGKRLAPYKSIFTDDPVLGNKDRYFGTYVPDNDGYQVCGDVIKRESEQR